MRAVLITVAVLWCAHRLSVLIAEEPARQATHRARVQAQRRSERRMQLEAVIAARQRGELEPDWFEPRPWILPELARLKKGPDHVHSVTQESRR